MSEAPLVDKVPARSPHAAEAYVEPGVRLGPDVRIGQRAVVLANLENLAQPTTIGAGAIIGAHATILPGTTIGMRAWVAPGAVVTRSVPPFACVEGNPARIVGYVGTQASVSQSCAPPVATRTLTTRVDGVSLYPLKSVVDLRGNLSAGEIGREVPFEVKRFFLIYDVPSTEVRGEHAHLKCKQFLIAIRGSVRAFADDGRNREEFILDKPDIGLYLPPMVWGTQYCYSPDALLLVLASEHYDSADYIRTYDQFLETRLEN